MALEVYAATDQWPRSERFGVTARFLSISLGSLAELSYLLLFARDRALCSDADWQRLEAQRDHAGKLVYGLYRRVRTPLAAPIPTD